MADELDDRPQGQREISLAELVCMDRTGLPKKHIAAWAADAGAIVSIPRQGDECPSGIVIDLPRLRAWLHEHGTEAWLVGGIQTLTANGGVMVHVPLAELEARARSDQVCKRELRRRGLS